MDSWSEKKDGGKVCMHLLPLLHPSDRRRAIELKGAEG